MPLLCISLLALLFLPPSLSCNSSRANVLRDNFRAVEETLLNSATRNISALVSNFSCHLRRPKLENCTANKNEANIVNTLLILACKIQNLGLSQTKVLGGSIRASIDCQCPTKSPDGEHKRKKKVTRRRRNAKRMRKKLCKANAILLSMRQCYEILNTLSMDT
ncbi:hypothetical protein OJAV_G00199050 [Oryzias javanicus]|uniref:Interleukin-7 n=1 Tax=Oryzias javanicus TaxID=123683 RepID=A0A437C959_ORYJA|nr:hypothetical protein OJAV_G00199050 [Oryzias javanicus]